MRLRVGGTEDPQTKRTPTQAPRETPRAGSRMERSSGGKTRGCFCSSEQECGQLCRAEGHGEGEAGSQAGHGNTTGCWQAHSGTCGVTDRGAAGTTWSTGTDGAAGLEGRPCLGFLRISPRRCLSPGLPCLSTCAPPRWQGGQRGTGQREAGLPHNSLGEAGGGRRKEAGCTERNGLLAVQVHRPFSRMTS